jgi:hypothetical protein
METNHAHPKWALLAFAVISLVGVSVALALGSPVHDNIERELKQGKGLFFTGTDHAGPIRAHLAHHQLDLPVSAVRCVNCHDRAGDRTEGRAQVLSRQSLLVSQPRRGGPSTRFDQVSFCKLLATGVDPAWILINQTMPRYDLNDEQCRALWTYLESNEP